MMTMDEASQVSTDQVTLSARGISKMYAGQIALWAMDFTIEPGEVVALLGRNGAGKSTLVRILSGAQASDTGSVRIGQDDITHESAQHFHRAGIATVHQELEDFTDMTVLDNLFIQIPKHAPRVGPFVRTREMERMARDHLQQIGIDEIDLRSRCGDLSAAERRLVMIGRALLNPSTRFLILDEPTAQLGVRDVARLFKVISRLKQAGIGVIYVSHRLGEVLEICDRAIVLRDGCQVAALETSQLDEETLVPLLSGTDTRDRQGSGRERSLVLPSVPDQARTPARGSDRHGFAVVGLSGGTVKNVSMAIHPGEIVGLVGLVGSGKSSLGRLLIGVQRADSGTHQLDGRSIESAKFAQSAAHRIAYIPEDRKTLGLFPGLSITDNVMITALEQGRRSRGGLLSSARLNRASKAALQGLNVAMSSVRQNIGELSGGNQQKVLVARALLSNASTYVLDEPTHGMDLLAKRDLVELIRQLAGQNAGVLWISSDIDEVSEICDRILVMHEGRLVAECKNPRETTLEALVGASFGRTAQPGLTEIAN